MSNIYWVGIRESDLLSTGPLYDGSITFFGSGEGGNLCLFCGEMQRRNHNQKDAALNQFYSQTMKAIVEKNPSVRFMFYNQDMVYRIEKSLIDRAICFNDQSILDILNNKMLCKLWLKESVPVLPNIQIFGGEISLSTLQKRFSDSRAFVIQPDVSSGGHNTYILNEKNHTAILERLDTYKLYSVSPYKENAIPINVHSVIYKNGFQLYPGSIQIIQKEQDQLIYKGGDFAAARALPDDILELVRTYANNICEKLQRTGYLGVCGIDFVAVEDSVYFMEINPRFQASTFVLNRALQEQGLASINQSCMDAFSGVRIEQELPGLNVPYSFFTHVSGKTDPRIHCHILKKYFSSHPHFSILADGYRPEIPAEPGAYLFRTIYARNLVSFSLGEMRLAELLTGYPVYDGHSHMQLKTMLINYGVTISQEAMAQIMAGGRLREANFSAIDLLLEEGDLVVNCPYCAGLTEYSPFDIRLLDNTLMLFFFDIAVSPIQVYYESALNYKRTKSGVFYSSIAFLATDRLRINYNPVCYYKQMGQSCSFCNLPNKNQAYDQADISEIVEDYLQHKQFRHILIGGGSGHPDSGFQDIIRLSEFLRTKTDKPLYLMSLPPRDPDYVKALCQAGISEMAFNIEIFDRALAVKYMPGKGNIPLNQYIFALSEAVRYLGPCGNVRSMLIVGFDPKETLLKGVRTLCEIGVQPMLSIFRPMAGTPLELCFPPKLQELLEIFERSVDICRQYGLTLGPSCAACQNNTLSLPQWIISSGMTSEGAAITDRD